MSQPSTYQLHVTGMSCQHCVKAITQAIQDQDGEAQVNIDLASSQVEVKSVLNETTVRALIQEEGFGITP